MVSQAWAPDNGGKIKNELAHVDMIEQAAIPRRKKQESSPEQGHE